MCRGGEVAGWTGGRVDGVQVRIEGTEHVFKDGIHISINYINIRLYILHTIPLSFKSTFVSVWHVFTVTQHSGSVKKK